MSCVHAEVTKQRAYQQAPVAAGKLSESSSSQHGTTTVAAEVVDDSDFDYDQLLLQQMHQADGSASPVSGYSQLGKVALGKPGGVNTGRLDDISPNRIHPNRLFYPGQMYEPDELNVFKQDSLVSRQEWSVPRSAVTNAGALRDGSFKNQKFLSQFLSETGKIIPRRRVRLQQKVHRHLGRQIRLARSMALLNPTAKLPQFNRGRN